MLSLLRNSGALKGAFRANNQSFVQKAYNSNASGANQPKSGNNLFLYAVPVLAAAGYYYYSTNGKETAKAIPAQLLPSGLNAQEFTAFKLKEVSSVSHDTKLLRFELPENSSLQLPIASCLVTRKPVKEGEKPTIRPYTPTSLENEVGHFDLIVKKYDTGALTPFIFNMKPGDTLDFKGPFPKYLYKANTLSEIGMIAGGTGITPMLQLIRKIVPNPEDKTKVTLLFANKTEKDILLKEELDNLAKQHPDKFKIEYVLDSPSASWTGTKGFVTKDLIQKKLPASTDSDAMIFVCGPEPMVKVMSGSKKSPQDQGELTGYLKELGFTKEKVFKF